MGDWGITRKVCSMIFPFCQNRPFEICNHIYISYAETMQNIPFFLLKSTFTQSRLLCGSLIPNQDLKVLGVINWSGSGCHLLSCSGRHLVDFEFECWEFFWIGYGLSMNYDWCYHTLPIGSCTKGTIRTSSSPEPHPKLKIIDNHF